LLTLTSCSSVSIYNESKYWTQFKTEVITQESLFITFSLPPGAKVINVPPRIIKNPTHLEAHLQTLVDFWDNILFYSGGYRKNAMQPHLDLHQKEPFKPVHFDHWLSSFNSAVDELYNGDIAHAAKSRALSIATVMKIKISELKT